jgi:nucleoside-triphosphatase THEP1
MEEKIILKEKVKIAYERIYKDGIKVGLKSSEDEIIEDEIDAGEVTLEKIKELLEGHFDLEKDGIRILNIKSNEINFDYKSKRDRVICTDSDAKGYNIKSQNSDVLKMINRVLEKFE